MHEQKKPPFPQNKNVSFTENLPKRSQKRRSSANQTLFIYTSLSLLPIQKNPFPPSIFHSHPAITYCPPKNTAILSQSALNPHAVTPEPRTDSKPLRRRFADKTGFDTCRRQFLRSLFRQSFESWVAGLRPACFLVTFCTTQKVTTRIPLQETPRFSKPQISAPQ